MDIDFSSEKLINVDLEQTMKTSFIQYSMSVITARALPDVRDGLKPVHRRIIYTMNDAGNTADKPFRKCAYTVGEVLGKYHPHGDASVYDALVRLAQDFSLRYPLIDGHRETLVPSTATPLRLTVILRRDLRRFQTRWSRISARRSLILQRTTMISSRSL